VGGGGIEKGGGGGGGGRDGGIGNGGGGGGGSGGSWCDAVEELELDHLHLRKLHGLEALANLRRVSLCNNELAKIEGLEHCRRLEELSLEGTHPHPLLDRV